MITEDILVKYLAGETEPHEVAMIEKWRRDSEENEKHFKQLEMLWIGSAGLQKSNAVNVDEAWQKVRSKAHTPARGKIISLNARWLVAASLVVLIGLAIFFTSRSTSQASEMISLNAVKTMQTVQLSDGSKLLVRSGQVSYPKTFDGSKRKVKLNSGKVFFEISPDKEKLYWVPSLKSYHMQIIHRSWSRRAR
jgi:transmembrane sensor